METVKSFPGGLKYDWDGLANVPEALKNTPAGAAVGQILEVTKVDGTGKILGVKAVDKPSGGGNGYTLPVGGDQLGGVKNGGNVVIKPDGTMDAPVSGGNVDLTGYATEQYVKDYAQPKGEYLTEVPDGYAKTVDIPTKPEDIGAQPAGNYLTEVPSGYATEEFVKNKIAEAELGGEEVDLSGYAQKSELPTKVSELENDAGYLTEHQDLSDYAKKTELPVVPVQSVNGQTGEVKLTAGDVGAISQDDLQEATNEALAQAKASGEFDGPQGPKGDPGEPGVDGADYILTDADKTEIAKMAAEAGGQPDWNAAEGEAGHILNRTHWAENAVVPFLPETVIEIPVDEETGEPLGWNYEIGALPFVAGKTYIIVWNGVSYESVCRQVEVDGMAVFHVGNPLALEMEDDGCPVALLSAPAMTATMFEPLDENEDPAGSVLAIYEKQDIVHRLDDRFIDAQWLAKKAVEETELVSLDTLMNQINYIPYEQLKLYNEVRVVFDGVSYECTVYHRDSGSYFGNLRMGLDADEFPHTGEPFWGICNSDGTSRFIPFDENYERPVAIYGIHKTVEKMPEEFLPEGYSKDELVAAVIAALPSAEEASF